MILIVSIDMTYIYVSIRATLVNAQETAKVAQALHAGTIQQQIENKSEVNLHTPQTEQKKHWWQRKK